MTAAFPGAIYHHGGACVDRRRSALTITRLHSYSYRLLVRLRTNPTMLVVWALSRQATADLIPDSHRGEAAGYMIGGGGVLLLGHQPGALKAVRAMLLAEMAKSAELVQAVRADDGRLFGPRDVPL